MKYLNFSTLLENISQFDYLKIVCNIDVAYFFHSNIGYINIEPLWSNPPLERSLITDKKLNILNLLVNEANSKI